MQRILNIAEEALVSFPNFACWDVRFRLLFSGKMPKGKQLPFEWYDTPNIHLFTLNDFLQLCRDEKLRIVKSFCTPRGILGRLLCLFGLCNIGASRVTARLTHEEDGGAFYE
jgi:homoserine O-acetyltransferase